MAGGFLLKKWISNDPLSLEDILSSMQLFPTYVPIDQNATVYALGMSWNPTSDTFHFTWKVPSLKQLTKRSVLSTLVRRFDPLDLLSLIVITAKIFIQELWIIKLGWDRTLSDKWNNFLRHLQ